MHNDLIQIDTYNRQRALELENFIVEAPAGAGKTELLTQRYLKLLARVEAPEEIIALTFTNKAAAEMRNRILMSLEAAENNTLIDAPHKQVTRDLAIKALAHAKNNGWQLLSQPARLRIQTMDALCSSLARQMPLLSRFGGQPIISLDADAHYQAAAQQALAQVASESSLDDIVSTALRFMQNDIEKLTKLLANMLAKRDQWLPLVGEHANITADEIAENVANALAELIEQKLALTLKAIPISIQLQLMPLMRFAASNVQPDHLLQALADWESPLSESVGDLSTWQALAGGLLTKDGTFRKNPNINDGFPAKDKNHPEYDEYKQQFAYLTELIADPQTLDSVRHLPSVDLDLITKDCANIKAFAQLLQLATAHLWTTFQAANEVDFVAIAQSASYALENERGATDLALKLDYKIAHLLVDEFQDTSPTQMRLIEQLTLGWQPDDGRTLFCVGDPMQSIYRFRKADVSLFLQASKFGIGQLPLTPLKLTRNNRSHPQVVRWINTTFKSIFPTADNITQAAISYRTFIATKDASADEGVCVHPLVLDSDEESEQAKLIEARYVADLITTEQKNNPENKIVVLVRSRNHLNDLVSVIRRDYAHIRFQAVEIESLNDRQTVLDALSLTRAMLHRADRVHWLNMLRAPWCGLTLADLHSLAHDNHFATIWQLMQDENRLQMLSSDGQQRLRHMHDILNEAFQHQGRMPLRRWLESTWLKLGGADTLISAGDNRDIQAFFDLVEKTARGFVIDFNQLDTAMQKLFAQPDITANDNLQFLTIHASKGLEFDTVILPALNRKPLNPDSPMMLWEKVPVCNHRALIATPFAKKIKGQVSNYDFLKALETERIDNETARLLYVAATRSIQKLHLVAAVKKSQKDEIKPVAKSLLSLLWPSVEAQFLAATTINAQAQNVLRLQDFTPQLKRLKAPCLPDLLKHTNIQSAYISPDNSDNSASNTLLNIAADTGTLTHLYMEMIANIGLAAWPINRIHACAPAMQLWFKQKGHAAENIDTYVNTVINALCKTVESADCAWLLQASETRQSELSITTIDPLGQPQEHRIDLTFIEQDTKMEKRWIIDYKLTFSEDGADLDLLAEQHRPQLSRYAVLFEHEGLPIQTAVFFLAHGKLVLL
ncbi:MAG: exodeoxyribonuclease V [Methylotenera sp.]|nr:MAG: exodeoxyribonuclease V [Methylotenera sp.]